MYFDDIDDYDGWSASPPQSKSGQALAGLEGLRTAVEVVNVDPASLSQVVADGASDLKRITVRVYRNDDCLVTLTRLRTRAQGEQTP